MQHSEHGRLVPDPRLRFRIYALGPAWVECDGKPLNILRRQTRALLYRLAGQRQPVPREELCYAFWPDTPEPVAHRHLSHLLSHLREALPCPDLVIINSELVELDAERVWCDAIVFRACCSRPDSRQMDVLRQGLDLYRGPFLSGFSLPDGPEFEVWTSQQRSALERIYLDALLTMVRAAANEADWAGAIGYARDYLKIDELAEEVHRRLMVLHVMMGDRGAALQQYRTCAAILQRELGVSPLPTTRAIYQAIVQNEI